MRTLVLLRAERLPCSETCRTEESCLDMTSSKRDSMDTYNNLTIKTLMCLKWVKKNLVAACHRHHDDRYGHVWQDRV